MKRKVLVIVSLLCICLCISACKKEDEVVIDAPDDEIVQEDASATDDFNRPIIASALGVSEDDRSLKFILSDLDYINAGRVQMAIKVNSEDATPALDITTEDGASYRVYLTESNSVDGIKNLKSGEWVIQSER